LARNDFVDESAGAKHRYHDDRVLRIMLVMDGAGTASIGSSPDQICLSAWRREVAGVELPVAAWVRVLDLVAYQEGAVVSRTLLKRTAGTVTAFAFDGGQGLSEHTAPFDALVHVLEGDADINIAGTAHRLSAGEMILMPANQPHALTARTPFKMLLTMIRSA
jgi:quercetin dioxygenase-like cupin family protein